MRTPNITSRQKFITLALSTGKNTLTRQEIKFICDENKLGYPQWFLNDNAYRKSRGVYSVSNLQNISQSVNLSAQVIPMKKVESEPILKNKISNITTDLEIEDLIPKVYKNYVPFGNFEDLLSVVESKQFFPIFITGQSGNGKTMSVEQACAKAKRKFVCVSMTPETDEGDLLGNYVLINGQMEWRDGPVTTAARQGAVLCIDEIDYGAQNLSCLQRILEGKPFLLKKKGELIYPQDGFTVVATANTKGKGSEDGRYMFTNVLNEAFLERFLNTYEQEFPSVAIEKRIIKKELTSVGRTDDSFADKLVVWADVIRKTFLEGGIDEIISTRRLVHICKTYGVYGDKMKSISLCLNRFDMDTKLSFLDLYSKLENPTPETTMPETTVPE